MSKITLEIPDFDERGVSPVIGVILMVAITVILAAVIASFVLGFGDSVQQNVQAGAGISADEGDMDGTVDITWISEGTADDLTVSVTGDTANLGSSSDQTLSNVGDTVSYSESGLGSPTDTQITIVVTANSDGESTVVSQKQVTI